MKLRITLAVTLAVCTAAPALCQDGGREVIQDLSEATLARVAARRHAQQDSNPPPASEQAASSASSRPAATWAMNIAPPIPAAELATDVDSLPRGAMPYLQPSHAEMTVLLTLDNWRPLTDNQKFALFYEDMLSWETHGSLAGDAAFSLFTHDRDYLGRGGKGFMHRYAINVADEGVGSFLGAYMLPVIFHEDPRYLPMDRGGKCERARYALSRVIFTRNDHGGEEVNKSLLITTFAGSFISNAYSKHPDNSAGATLTRGAIALGSDAGFNLLQEFWPDITRKMHLNLFFQHLLRRSIKLAGDRD
jgi:hypothetical protein